MIKIGKINTLRIVDESDNGLLLEGGKAYGSILLPNRYVPDIDVTSGIAEVMVYFDSEDRIVATTETPSAQVGDVAFLRVVHVNKFGAFLDWGLAKDLFVPFKEQKIHMEEGRQYIVYIYHDEESDRIAASAKIDKFIHLTPPEYEENEKVDIVVTNRTDLGYKAVINSSHWGMLYHTEVFKSLHIGATLSAHIKKVREDGKIDLILQKPGFEGAEDFSFVILRRLKESHGFLPLHDKSPAEKIYAEFGVSKKVFKRAIGMLFKQKRIYITERGIKLV